MDIGQRGPITEHDLASIAEVKDASGIRILNATKSREGSWEDPKLQHGVFTYYLIQALQDQSRYPNGMLTFDSLKDKLTLSFNEYNRRTGRHQKPYESDRKTLATSTLPERRRATWPIRS